MASKARAEAVKAILDAAERLLVEVGYAEITTRKLAEEADLNHGLVHYYFGSMEEVFLQLLERYNDRLIERQREMYSGPGSFIKKWRTAVGPYFDRDVETGYVKIRLELEAMAWNHPGMRERMQRVREVWRGVLTDAFSAAMNEYGLDRKALPVEVVVALVVTSQHGMQLDRLLGIDAGHEDLLSAIDRWLEGLERERKKRGRGAKDARSVSGPRRVRRR